MCMINNMTRQVLIASWGEPECVFFEVLMIVKNHLESCLEDLLALLSQCVGRLKDPTGV